MDISTLKKAKEHFYGLLLAQEIPNAPDYSFNSEYQCGVWDCIRWIEEQQNNFDKAMDEYRRRCDGD